MREEIAHVGSACVKARCRCGCEVAGQSLLNYSCMRCVLLLRAVRQLAALGKCHSYHRLSSAKCIRQQGRPLNTDICVGIRWPSWLK